MSSLHIPLFLSQVITKFTFNCCDIPPVIERAVRFLLHLLLHFGLTGPTMQCQLMRCRAIGGPPTDHALPQF
jgi:hypothetical protein